jgi:aryl-alcohol dehydrogenase-like predicted oxidoreductase
MNGRPEHLRRACEGSLKRLRVERIDLFQLHRIDPAVPEADQFGTLAELRDEGKIRLVGLSEVDVPAIERARATLPIVSVQNRYNIAERAWQAVVDYCERERIAFLPWYPLGAGSMKVPAAVQQVADRRGATPLQVALAWLLASSPIMLPIPGTSKVPHLEQNVAAASLQLTPDEMRELEQVQTG